VPRLLRPRALPRGGTVAIAAPAFWVEPARVHATAERLLGAGYQVTWREDVFARSGYLAGSAERRAAELMQWVRDDSVHAILCARGGFGCHHVIPRLSAREFRAARKPLVGFSDITTLLGWQREVAGLAGLHGPMCVRDDGPTPAELRALLAALYGDVPVPLRGRGGARGRAEGPLVGGSLTLVAASLGTPWAVDARGAILLLEDTGERPFRIDRMLQQLRHSGVLAGVAGVGLGHFDRCAEPDGFIHAGQILREWLDATGVPWVSGLPFGHGAPNLAWPMGVRARLDGARATLHILERGVAESR
jgi:muramoyltetrapeptide carboxypeptidase